MDRGLLCWIDDERPPRFGKAERSQFEERVYHNFTILVCSQIMAVGVWLTLCRLEHGRALGKKQNSRHFLSYTSKLKAATWTTCCSRTSAAAARRLFSTRIAC